MSTIYAPKTDRAIEALERGNSEPLAKMIEANELAGLISRMKENEELRQVIADTLRGKFLRKRGRPKSRYLSAEDRALLERICYWCGHGVGLWQVEAEDTACHRAVRDLENEGLLESKRSPEAVYKKVWAPRAEKLTWFDELALASSYLEGLRDSMADIETFKNRLNWADKNGIKLDWRLSAGSTPAD